MIILKISDKLYRDLKDKEKFIEIFKNINGPLFLDGSIKDFESFLLKEVNPNELESSLRSLGYNTLVFAATNKSISASTSYPIPDPLNIFPSKDKLNFIYKYEKYDLDFLYIIESK